MEKILYGICRIANNDSVTFKEHASGSGAENVPRATQTSSMRSSYEVNDFWVVTYSLNVRTMLGYHLSVELCTLQLEGTKFLSFTSEQSIAW